MQKNRNDDWLHDRLASSYNAMSSSFYQSLIFVVSLQSEYFTDDAASIDLLLLTMS